MKVGEVQGRTRSSNRLLHPGEKIVKVFWKAQDTAILNPPTRGREGKSSFVLSKESQPAILHSGVRLLYNRELSYGQPL